MDPDDGRPVDATEDLDVKVKIENRYDDLVPASFFGASSSGYNANDDNDDKKNVLAEIIDCKVSESAEQILGAPASSSTKASTKDERIKNGMNALKDIRDSVNRALEGISPEDAVSLLEKITAQTKNFIDKLVKLPEDYLMKKYATSKEPVEFAEDYDHWEAIDDSGLGVPVDMSVYEKALQPYRFGPAKPRFFMKKIKRPGEEDRVFVIDTWDMAEYWRQFGEFNEDEEEEEEYDDEDEEEEEEGGEEEEEGEETSDNDPFESNDISDDFRGGMEPDDDTNAPLPMEAPLPASPVPSSILGSVSSSDANKFFHGNWSVTQLRLMHQQMMLIVTNENLSKKLRQRFINASRILLETPGRISFDDFVKAVFRAKSLHSEEFVVDPELQALRDDDDVSVFFDENEPSTSHQQDHTSSTGPAIKRPRI